MKTAKSGSCLAILVLVLVTPAAWGVMVELVDPPAIAIPSGYSDMATAKAIKSALQEQQWKLQSESPEEMTAELLVNGQYYVKVSVLYDERYVRIRYLDSRNMYYQQGVLNDTDENEWAEITYRKRPQIHYRYNRWVKDLAAGIKRALETSSATGP